MTLSSTNLTWSTIYPHRNIRISLLDSYAVLLSEAGITVEALQGIKVRAGGSTGLCGSKIIIFLVQDYSLRECVHNSWTAQMKNWNHTSVSEGLT